ncbi:hypothetical protein [Glycomyces salinus]|uniref:hypothetical protein n=1 Tax=Glycomyces salinus TaxID=980294 RepID=UPI0018ED0628|nr:hypothetical protein [Glycomyces salinus]
MRRALTILTLLLVVLVAQVPASAIDEDLPRSTASFNDDVRKVAYDGDVLYVGGMFTRARDVDGEFDRRYYLAAIDSVSGRLLPFAPELDGKVYDVVAHGGYLYVAGNFRYIDDTYTPRVARFRLDSGRLDTTWRPGPSATVFAIEPLGDRVYLGGRFAKVGQTERRYLAAVTADTGAVVESFTPSLQEGSVRDIEYGHGRLYVSGSFSYAENEKRYGKLAAFEAGDGDLDRDFDPRIFVLTRQITLYGDQVYAALDGRGGEVRAFDQDGDTLWYQGVDGGMQAVAVWNGTVIAGGHFDRACTTNRSGPTGECVDGVLADRGKLLAVDTDGNLLRWNPGANGVIGVWDLKTHPRGSNLAAGGSFTTFGDGEMEQKRLAVFD